MTRYHCPLAHHCPVLDHSPEPDGKQAGIQKAADLPGRLYIVSRHQGAVDFVRTCWPERQAFVISHLPAHFAIHAGDCFVGVLPMHWAAAICEKGSEVWSICADIPERLRGKELSCAQLIELGARLQRFEVRVCVQAFACAESSAASCWRVSE